MARNGSSGMMGFGEAHGGLTPLMIMPLMAATQTNSTNGTTNNPLLLPPSTSSPNLRTLNTTITSTTSTDPDHFDNILIKAKIMSHPQYPRLLSAYVNYHKVGAPPEVVARLEEACASSLMVGRASSSSFVAGDVDDPALDQFMEAYSCEMLTKYEQELSKPFKEVMLFLSRVDAQFKPSLSSLAPPNPQDPGIPLLPFMAANNTVSQPSLPIFKGDSYDFWSIKMKTLFKSLDLWDLVEQGYSNSDDDKRRLKENRKRDSKALFIIQQALLDTVFSRIAATTTSKQAWTILQTEFERTSKVIAVKLQTLRQEFKTFQMKGNESVQAFISRMVSIVNQMKTYGDLITDQNVAAKVLKSLTPKFDHVVAAIEESKGLSTLTIDELSGSLQEHETRLNRLAEKSEAQMFHMKGEAQV